MQALLIPEDAPEVVHVPCTTMLNANCGLLQFLASWLLPGRQQTCMPASGRQPEASDSNLMYGRATHPAVQRVDLTVDSARSCSSLLTAVLSKHNEPLGWAPYCCHMHASPHAVHQPGAAESRKDAGPHYASMWQQ